MVTSNCARSHVFSPLEFSHFMAGETEKWTKVVRSAKIKPE
jgi:hypothetical protein